MCKDRRLLELTLRLVGLESIRILFALRMRSNVRDHMVDEQPKLA